MPTRPKTTAPPIPASPIASGSQPVYLVHQPSPTATPAARITSGRPCAIAACVSQTPNSSQAIQVTSVSAVRL